MRFVVVGGVATGIQYGLYLILQFLGISFNLAYTIGYILSFIFNFVASNYFTFKVQPNVNRGIKFLGAHCMNYLIQVVLLNIFAVLNVNLSIAPILVFAVSIPVNFLLVRKALK